jgi:hypothetical protein
MLRDVERMLWADDWAADRLDASPRAVSALPRTVRQ